MRHGSAVAERSGRIRTDMQGTGRLGSVWRSTREQDRRGTGDETGLGGLSVSWSGRERHGESSRSARVTSWRVVDRRVPAWSAMAIHS